MRVNLSAANVAEYRAHSRNTVPHSVRENLTAVCEENGKAALKVAAVCMRKEYTGENGQSTLLEEREERADSDDEEQPALSGEPLPEQVRVPFDSSLCYQEQSVGVTDRLQYAAFQQLKRMRDPSSGKLVSPQELGSETPEDAAALEHLSVLVQTYDPSSPFRSINPKWLLLLFPDVFPNGTGLPPKGVSEERWLRYLISVHGSPCQNADFICAVADKLMRQRTNLASYLQYRLNPGKFRGAAKTTEADVERVATLLVRCGHPAAADSQAVKDLHSQVNRRTVLYYSIPKL